MKKKEVEVLFCYEKYDELVLMKIRKFDGSKMNYVEKEMRKDKE
jgi:TNF receptor-associated protein 1